MSISRQADGMYNGDAQMKKKSCDMCGKRSVINGKVVQEYCGECKAYNDGYAKAEKIRKKSERPCCQFITCSRRATHVICIDEFILKSCQLHTGGRETKLIPDDEYEE